MIKSLLALLIISGSIFAQTIKTNFYSVNKAKKVFKKSTSFEPLYNLDGLNQSYFVDGDGRVQSVVSLGNYVYNYNKVIARGPFLMKNRVEHVGASYYVDYLDGIWTMDRQGYFYEQDRTLISGKDIEVHGGNYFQTDDGLVHMVNSEGFKLYKTAAFVDTEITMRGGVYFTTEDERFIVVKPDGWYTDLTAVFKKFKLSIESIRYFGHNYFITKSGTLYSIGFHQMTKKDKDGNTVPVFSKSRGLKMYGAFLSRAEYVNPQNKKRYIAKYKKVSIVGGNYFIDKDGVINTVSFTGIVNGGDARRKFKAYDPVDGLRTDLPIYVGNNYFIYADETIMIVDHAGIYTYAQDSLSKELIKADRNVQITTKPSYRLVE